MSHSKPFFLPTPVLQYRRLTESQRRSTKSGSTDNQSTNSGQKKAGSLFLKMEAWHRAGSFKIRGMSALCSHYADRGIQKLYCSSGGNAAIATALAAQQLGQKLIAYVPDTTSAEMKNRIRAIGAEVVVKGKNWNTAHEWASRQAGRENAGYVHPFDHPLIWQGHSSIIDECIGQMDKPHALVAAVGGGGLMCGLLEGMHRNGWHDVPFIAVETLGTASLAAALKAGKPIKIPRIEGIAHSLGARQVSDQCLIWADKHEIIPVQVSDKMALAGCRRITELTRTLTEPACGAAMAAVAELEQHSPQYRDVLIIVCGGMSINMPQ